MKHVFLLWFVAASMGVAYAQPAPVIQQEIFAAFRLPGITNMVCPPDTSHRMFVTYQGGIIKIFDLAHPNVAPKTCLSIGAQLSVGGEMGLLGLAFHPRYVDSGYVYLNYTAPVSGQLTSFITRYTRSDTNANVLDPASKKVLLTYDQPFQNHNGGQVAFGPDGYLYIAVGDGGSGGDPLRNGQNKRTLLGKILRIDVDHHDAGLAYSIPPSNPFADSTGGQRKEIYTYGMRNPWRFSFDRLTGRGWIGDVGQNAVEEVDTLVRGGNYGWNIKEGRSCFGTQAACSALVGAIDPVWQYPHSQGISITGGYVYRGTTVPSLYGKYLYGDYGTGNVWCIDISTGAAVNTLLMQTGLNISTFGQDNDGEMYMTNYNSGAIYQLKANPLAAKRATAIITRARMVPNPFGNQATLEVNLAAAATVNAYLIDSKGARVLKMATAQHLGAGQHALQANTAGLPAGTYLMYIEAGQTQLTQKVVLAR